VNFRRSIISAELLWTPQVAKTLKKLAKMFSFFLEKTTP